MSTAKENAPKIKETPCAILGLRSFRLSLPFCAGYDYALRPVVWSLAASKGNDK